MPHKPLIAVIIPEQLGTGQHVFTFAVSDDNGCTTLLTDSFSVDICEGIAEGTALPDVRIHPNPAANSINVSGIGPRGAIIFNATGQRVGQVPQGNEMDVTSLPSGIYWVVGDDAHGRIFRLPFVKR